MRETVTELLKTYLSGSRMSPEQLLWSILVFGLILSGIHLLTMLSTRWGNRGITTKALIFSLVVHLSCISGMVAVEPKPYLAPAGGREEERTAVIELRGFADGSPDEVENPQERNTSSLNGLPVWDKIAEPAPVEMTRAEPAASLPAPAEVVRPEPQGVAPPEIDLKVPPLLPEAPAAEPKVEIASDPARPREGPETPTVDAGSAAEARPDVTAPAPSKSRSATTGAAPASPQTAVTRTEQPTGPQPVDVLIPEGKKPLTTITDAPPRPEADIERGPQPESSIGSESPAPSTVGAPEAVAPEGPPGGAPASPGRVVARTRTTAQETGGTTVERTRPEGTPAAPEIPERSEVVRNGTGTGTSTTNSPSPDVTRPEFDAVRSRKNSGVPSTYRLRNIARRPQIARALGGTDESEKAVEASLKWLAKSQHPEGYWDADAFGAGKVKIDENKTDRDYAGRDADAGVTALSVLAFLAAGYTHEEGQYAEQVDRAITWLIRQQRPDGNLGYGAGHFAQMYCHGMATYALAEAYGMQSDPATNTRLREPVTKAVDFILDHQNPRDGGWRYKKGQEGDMSMFGWQLMALKSAEIAGIRTPPEARSKMVAFLRERSLGDNQGLAGYRKNQPPSPAMTAEALFCKQMLGIKRNNAACTEAVSYLLARPPKRSDWNEYYWYYGTLAMYQHGGPEWQTWNAALRDQLIDEQRTTGELAGSWDPRAPWGGYGGRVYSTALSTLCLEVYYRFLPLYQIGGEKFEDQ